MLKAIWFCGEFPRCGRLRGRWSSTATSPEWCPLQRSSHSTRSVLMRPLDGNRWFWSCLECIKVSHFVWAQIWTKRLEVDRMKANDSHHSHCVQIVRRHAASWWIARWRSGNGLSHAQVIFCEDMTNSWPTYFNTPINIPIIDSIGPTCTNQRSPQAFVEGAADVPSSIAETGDRLLPQLWNKQKSGSPKTSRCLLIRNRFHEASRWNYRLTGPFFSKFYPRFSLLNHVRSCLLIHTHSWI